MREICVMEREICVMEQLEEIRASFLGGNGAADAARICGAREVLPLYDIIVQLLQYAQSVHSSKQNTYDPERQIALIWSLEDVNQIRPDLTGVQALSVLHEVKRTHDATQGVSWDMLAEVAEMMFPRAQRIEPAQLIAPYTVKGCREYTFDGEHHIEAVSDDEAEFWGVYGTLPDGTTANIADFQSRDDALAFASMKSPAVARDDAVADNL